MNEGYDVAQICINGHLVNSSSRSMSQFNQKFCEKCGAETITQCPSCKLDIRGYYHSPGFISLAEESIPSFCHNCGKSYPWTESALDAAQELADELSELTDEEKDLLKKSLPDLIKETPKTKVAESRFKKIMSKAKKESVDAMRSILVDIISETIKKSLFGNANKG